jgi:hypothetical protein
MNLGRTSMLARLKALLDLQEMIDDLFEPGLLVLWQQDGL